MRRAIRGVDFMDLGDPVDPPQDRGDSRPVNFGPITDLHEGVKSIDGTVSDDVLKETIKTHYDAMTSGQRQLFVMTCGYSQEILDQRYSFDPNQLIEWSGLPLDSLANSYRQVFGPKP